LRRGFISHKFRRLLAVVNVCRGYEHVLRMKEIVISILLFVSAFALFPYVGMILSSTCDHSPSVAATGRWLRRKHAVQLTEIQSRYLFQGEYKLLMIDDIILSNNTQNLRLS
jgi:hypothetical protein